MCDLIITDGTLRAIEKNLNISYKTAIFRRFKIFVAIEDYIKHLKLKNFVYFDEIFVKLINPDSDYKKAWDAKKRAIRVRITEKLQLRLDVIQTEQ